MEKNIHLNEKIRIILNSDIFNIKSNLNKIPKTLEMFNKYAYIIEQQRGDLKGIQNEFEKIAPKYALKGNKELYLYVLEKTNLLKKAEEIKKRAYGNPFSNGTYLKP